MIVVHVGLGVETPFSVLLGGVRCVLYLSRGGVRVDEGSSGGAVCRLVFDGSGNDSVLCFLVGRSRAAQSIVFG